MLTGPDFHEEHVLDDGTHVVLRHIRADDAEELKHAFDKLSPSSRYGRFFTGVSGLSVETLRYLTNVDEKNHVAIVATTHRGQDGPEVGLGVARFIRAADDPSVAEVAITVIDEMQHKGLGRILGVALARAAVERNVRRFRGQILRDNEPVRRLLDEVGADVHPLEGGELVFDVDLDPSDDPSVRTRLEGIARRVLAAASARLVGFHWHSHGPSLESREPR